MAIQWPTWVEDNTAIPAGFLVRAKRFIYIFAAIEKLRLLHNAGWKWVKGGELTPGEVALIAQEFPGQEEPPTEQQFKNWIETWWDPRQDEAQAFRAQARKAVTVEQVDLVDLQGLID